MLKASEGVRDGIWRALRYEGQVEDAPQVCWAPLLS